MQIWPFLFFVLLSHNFSLRAGRFDGAGDLVSGDEWKVSDIPLTPSTQMHEHSTLTRVLVSGVKKTLKCPTRFTHVYPYYSNLSWPSRGSLPPTNSHASKDTTTSFCTGNHPTGSLYTRNAALQWILLILLFRWQDIFWRRTADGARRR